MSLNDADAAPPQQCPSGCGWNEPCTDRWHDRQALHACVGCGLELDADDRNDRCEDCAPTAPPQPEGD